MRDGVLQGIRSNGDIIRYEQATGYFGVMRNGKISTFFRPDGDEYDRYKYFVDAIEQ